jgi:NAD(P)H-flavin reductase
MIQIYLFVAALSLSAVFCDAFVAPRALIQQPHNHYHVMFMGWGPEPIWSPATISTNDVACTSGICVSITVDLGNSEATKEYTIPGQYVQLRLNEDTKPLFLAISSPPSSSDDSMSGSFEFLVKKTDSNDWITDAPIGTAVQISQVLGKGFPMEENLNSLKYDFPTQNVLLFAVGSGIAPIKAAIESGQLLTGGNGGRSARLYYGERTPSDLCFTEHFAKWEAAGVEVVPVLSQPSSSWGGRSGYVQNALEEDGVPIPRNCGALLCGMKGMAESVKDILTKAGVFEGRVLTNF